jgi:CRP-like cAMP-binding protein
LTEQGAHDDKLYLLLDGVLVVEVDGSEVAEVGPGAVVGERALLEGGTRTSTLRARTACRVAATPFDTVDRDQLVALSGGHRRER